MEADELDLMLGFVCEKCQECQEETEDGKIVCHLDGQEKEKNDTCPYWW